MSLVFRTDKRRRRWVCGDYRIDRSIMLGCLISTYSCHYRGVLIGKAQELKGDRGALQICRDHAANQPKGLLLTAEQSVRLAMLQSVDKQQAIEFIAKMLYAHAQWGKRDSATPQSWYRKSMRQA